MRHRAFHLVQLVESCVPKHFILAATEKDGSATDSVSVTLLWDKEGCI
jgi:hypothetical protein